MTENLNKIWDKAEPLLEYIYSHFGSEIEQQLSEYRSTQTLPEPTTSNTAVVTNLLLTAQAMADRTVEGDARMAAFENLRSDLISERLQIVALEDSKDDEPPRIIPSTFWLRAKLSSDLNRTHTGARRFSELRVLSSEHQTGPSIHRSGGEFDDPPTRDRDNPGGGRPNTQELVTTEVTWLIENDPKFMAMPNRTDQAREVRVRLKGEDHRLSDDLAGMKTDTLKRWIGAALKANPKPSA